MSWIIKASPVIPALEQAFAPYEHNNIESGDTVEFTEDYAMRQSDGFHFDNCDYSWWLYVNEDPNDVDVDDDERDEDLIDFYDNIDWTIRSGSKWIVDRVVNNNGYKRINLVNAMDNNEKAAMNMENPDRTLRIPIQLAEKNAHN